MQKVCISWGHTSCSVICYARGAQTRTRLDSRLRGRTPLRSAPRLTLKGSGGKRTDQRKGSPGGLCLRGSLLAVSLIVACYGRPRIGNPVLPAGRSLFVGATDVTGVILAISLFTFGSVVRRSYCTCKFIQKETVVPKYRESLRAVSRLMLRLPWIISETRVGGNLASRAKRYAVMPYASKNSLFRISPGVGSCSVFIMSPPKLVIISDRYFCSFTIVEVEADPPLVVDTNGHLPRSAAFEFLQPIASRYIKINPG